MARKSSSTRRLTIWSLCVIIVIFLCCAVKSGGSLNFWIGSSTVFGIFLVAAAVIAPEVFDQNAIDTATGTRTRKSKTVIGIGLITALVSVGGFGFQAAKSTKDAEDAEKKDREVANTAAQIQAINNGVVSNLIPIKSISIKYCLVFPLTSNSPKVKEALNGYLTRLKQELPKVPVSNESFFDFQPYKYYIGNFAVKNNKTVERGVYATLPENDDLRHFMRDAGIDIFIDKKDFIPATEGLSYYEHSIMILDEPEYGRKNMKDFFRTYGYTPPRKEIALIYDKPELDFKRTSPNHEIFGIYDLAGAKIEIHVGMHPGNQTEKDLYQGAYIANLDLDFGNGYKFFGEMPVLNQEKTKKQGHNVFEFVFPKDRESLTANSKFERPPLLRPTESPQ